MNKRYLAAFSSVVFAIFAGCGGSDTANQAGAQMKQALNQINQALAAQGADTTNKLNAFNDALNALQQGVQNCFSGLTQGQAASAMSAGNALNGNTTGTGNNDAALLAALTQQSSGNNNAAAPSSSGTGGPNIAGFTNACNNSVASYNAFLAFGNGQMASALKQYADNYITYIAATQGGALSAQQQLAAIANAQQFVNMGGIAGSTLGNLAGTLNNISNGATNGTTVNGTGTGNVLSNGGTVAGTNLPASTNVLGPAVSYYGATGTNNTGTTNAGGGLSGTINFGANALTNQGNYNQVSDSVPGKGVFRALY